MNESKLQQIEDSHINGQKKQMCNQIKAYGIKAFMVDYMEYWKDVEYNLSEYTRAAQQGLSP